MSHCGAFGLSSGFAVYTFLLFEGSPRPSTSPIESSTVCATLILPPPISMLYQKSKRSVVVQDFTRLSRSQMLQARGESTRLKRTNSIHDQEL
ncbi:uncharacterized protein BDR25DRAFT_97333 [Lindgomyces ingoldianus]|uniref:Uncharacterized protein n=1 Tax=Lindgomyces ingoldianus TaxID=673940 RepID=A0ACB6QB06_9PLEO|nr:uncharacterized protein BDR25DRAFT_97333 [Lindgomyces ingoldianus]KAF2464219.1 hypothetical protein BDR25DRAFT_97333 [Lindgomyces ingoldianus]